MPEITENLKDKIEKALLKKAVGYKVTEITKEYQISDGEQVLIKKKVAQKSVPPDINAAKILFETLEKSDFTLMTDEELEKQKQRLLKLLNKDGV